MIHFVRHLPADAPGLCYGWLDVALTAASVDDLPRLVGRLATLAPSLIVSSDLMRCRILAEALAARHGVALHIDANWRERHFGRWEGRGWDAIYNEDPSIIARLMEPAFAPPGGESLTMLEARICKTLSTVPDNTLVVTHGGAIAVARGWMAGRPLDDVVDLIPAPGELVTVRNRRRAEP